MLSQKQQMFIMMLRMKPLTKKEISLFKSDKGFYMTTGYLVKNGLVKCEFIDEGRRQKRYYLSGKGEALALILETLNDKSRKSLSKYLVIR